MLVLMLALLQQGPTPAPSSGSGGGGLDPDLAALIFRVPSPKLGGPSVFNVASVDRLFAGDQLNLVTAAWLPRSLRSRLRQPPTLSPPTLSGVWSTPRAAVPGAVATRTEGEETYDLFVGTQTVYPLSAGALVVPPARLNWIQPPRGRGGEELRQTVESALLTIQVRPLPDAGRPPGFDGPVGRDLLIEYHLSGGAGRAGAALPLEVVLTGAGNLPLWPAPRIAWPTGIRVYDQGTDASFGPSGQRLGGSRRFRFAVVSDSAGSLALPPVEYPYFDPATATYRTARISGIVVPILEAAPVAERRSPLPIELVGAPSLAERVLALPGLALAGLILAPLFLVIGFSLHRRRSPRHSAPGGRPDSVERLETLVRSLLPPGTSAAPPVLTGALRQAGLSREHSARLVRLHLAVEAERYGPEGRGRGSTPRALVGEIDAALEKLPRPILSFAGIAALVLALLSAWPARAFAQTGIELYTRGEYAAAAQVFRTEAAVAVPAAARWYNLAAAEYLAQRDAHSVAALLAARATAPRDPRVRTLWNALAREHEELRRAPRSWPLTAEECLALSLLGLWIGTVLYVVAGRHPMIWGMVFLLAAGCSAAGLALRAERGGRRAVLVGGASLRVSPHGLAPERGAVPAYSVVRLTRQVGGWWLIRTGEGVEGWVPADILAGSPALN